MHLIMADQGGGSSSSSVMRDYRKGNWTVSETMVLIEAKKMDDERRMKRSTGESSAEAGRSSKPTELRWKWVEDYCWRKGCLRSQNQCNDKWDNLMRDYKKVRDYERRRITERSGGGDGNTTVRVEGSYWELEKNDRKEKNLPSNMLPQIYQALEEVVEKKGTHHKIANVGGGGGGGGSLASIPNTGYVVQPSLPPMLQHHRISGSIPLLPPPPPPPPPPLPPPQQPPMAQPAPPISYYPHLTVGSDTDTSDYSDSPAKRRRRGSGGDGTSGTANTSSSNHEVGSAIYKSGSIIAEALQGCEERQERRHRDLLSLHERRLKIEESKNEINRQGINGLVDAINKLANSILTLASHSKNQSSSK